MSRDGLVNSVIGELCAGMGLESPGLDADNRLTLDFGELPVTLSYSTEPAELLWINALLGEIPEQGIAGPRFLMHLAFEGWIVNRMTVGLDPDGRKVWGYSCIPVTLLTRELLEQTLTGLLEVAIPVSARIANQDFELPDTVPPRPQDDSNSTRV